MRGCHSRRSAAGLPWGGKEKKKGGGEKKEITTTPEGKKRDRVSSFFAVEKKAIQAALRREKGPPRLGEPSDLSISGKKMRPSREREKAPTGVVLLLGNDTGREPSLILDERENISA